jgi:hypothetical protein
MVIVGLVNATHLGGVDISELVNMLKQRKLSFRNRQITIISYVRPIK